MACRVSGIPCEVIPGITSAIAGPAAAGIPVTLRGVARTFAVLTAESGKQFSDPDHDWDALAKLDTLSILMGRRTLAQSTARLIAAGKDPQTPVACIERATFKTQRVVRGTLQSIAQIADQVDLRAPMVAVIGPVSNLAEVNQLANDSSIGTFQELPSSISQPNGKVVRS